MCYNYTHLRQVNLKSQSLNFFANLKLTIRLADDASKPSIAPNKAILDPLLGAHMNRLYSFLPLVHKSTCPLSRCVFAVLTIFVLALFYSRVHLSRLDKREGKLKGRNRGANLCSAQVAKIIKAQ